MPFLFAPLSPFLILPSLGYAGIIRLRARLYQKGLFRTRRLPRPVISVGNLTFGGTGKTPLTMFIAARLLDWGMVPVLLSRGYGRRAPDRSRIVPPPDQVDPAEFGDEPALVRRRVPPMWLALGKDRHKAGLEILKAVPDAVFLLDDGFQHLQLHRDLNILVIDASQPLGENRVAPLGTLREPLGGLARAHAVCLNGPPRPGLESTLSEYAGRPGGQARLYHFRQHIAAILPYGQWMEGLDNGLVATPVRTAYLVAAIANPRRYRRDVEELAIEVKGCRYFRDHSRIAAEQWKHCAREARRLKAEAIITTEKDAVKIGNPPSFPLMVAVQRTTFAEGEKFEGLLREACHGGRQRH
ncbi:MAG: tetraacyldisaccharide 4'-kinase [Acidobacteria bacterium]|nr:tetraacyldisaccharide 4'-kinase [Acidobacteriota bacterium]